LSPVFRHGSLRLYLLRLLDEEPRHGYEVIRLLRDRFMGVYSPSPGTIYPRLARLEEEGLVTHDEVDGRKVYRITEAGREELRSRSDELDELEEELSASVSDIVREVREDVRQTVRSLREELTWAARESRRMSRDAGADAREQARQGRDEAWEQARRARDEAWEQARQARDEAWEQARSVQDEAKEQARSVQDEAKEQARRAHQDAKEQARQAHEEAKQAYREAREQARQARQGRGDPWGQATDTEEAEPARSAGSGEAAGPAGTAEAAGSAGSGEAAGPAGTAEAAGSAGSEGSSERSRAEALGQDAARRVREHARWLREEAQRVREGSPETTGAAGGGGFRERIREQAGARFGGGEQDWDVPPGGTGWSSWAEWPGRRGWEEWTRMRNRRGWTGALDLGTLKDLERVAVQFTSDLRKLAMQSTAVGENVIGDLRVILEESLERIKTEIFGSEHEAPARRDTDPPASGHATADPAGPDQPGESADSPS
jgi:DNA-binding PadR family transcriptional regulator